MNSLMWRMTKLENPIRESMSSIVLQIGASTISHPLAREGEWMSSSVCAPHLVFISLASAHVISLKKGPFM
jgi:hypothetical protein